MDKQELLKELKAFHQEMIDEVNESSDDPEQDPDLDFALGYIAGVGYVIYKMEGELND